MDDLEARRAIRTMNDTFGVCGWNFCIASREKNAITGILTAPGFQVRRTTRMQDSFQNGDNPVVRCFIQCVNQLMAEGGGVLERSS